MKSLLSSHFSKEKLHYSALLAIVSVGSIALLSFVVKGSPATSELSYIERSASSLRFGSVIPASCDSSPPTSHFEGDCDPMVNLGVGADLASFTGISMTLSSTTAAYNEHPTLAWNTSGYTSCVLYQDDGTTKTAITPVAPGLNQNTYSLPYVNTTGSDQVLTYTLDCSNPPHKHDVKGVRVWYASLPLFPCPSQITAINYTLYKQNPDPVGVLPNGHQYCRYTVQDGGDYHRAAYDRVLGRAITFGFQITSGMIQSQTAYLTISAPSPSMTQFVDFGAVWASSCAETEADYYRRQHYCNERRFAGVANTADMTPDKYAPSYIDPQYTRFNCQFNPGWTALSCTPFDGYITPPDPCEFDPYAFGCPLYNNGN